MKVEWTQPISWESSGAPRPSRASPQGPIRPGIFTAVDSSLLDCPRQEVTWVRQLPKVQTLPRGDGSGGHRTSVAGRPSLHVRAHLLSIWTRSSSCHYLVLRSAPACHTITSFSTQRAPLQSRLGLSHSVVLIDPGFGVW